MLEEVPELFDLATKVKLSVFGSLIHKSLKDIGDIDLIIENPRAFLKDLKVISKKYSKTLDIVVEPAAEGWLNKKLIVDPDGRVIDTESFAGKGFFIDEVILKGG